MPERSRTHEPTRLQLGAWYPSSESQVSSTQVKILVPGNHLMVGLLGQRDELLRTVEEAFDGTRIHVRGNEITVEGPEADRVGRLFEELVALLEQGHWLDPTNVGHTIEMVKDDVRPSEVLNAEVGRSARGRKVHPKTAGQKRYVDAITANTITFGIAQPAPASLTSPSLWLCRPSRRKRWHASSSRARLSRPGKGSGSCQAI